MLTSSLKTAIPFLLLSIILITSPPQVSSGATASAAEEKCLETTSVILDELRTNAINQMKQPLHDSLAFLKRINTYYGQIRTKCPSFFQNPNCAALDSVVHRLLSMIVNSVNDHQLYSFYRTLRFNLHVVLENCVNEKLFELETINEASFAVNECPDVTQNTYNTFMTSKSSPEFDARLGEHLADFLKAKYKCFSQTLECEHNYQIVKDIFEKTVNGALKDSTALQYNIIHFLRHCAAKTQPHPEDQTSCPDDQMKVLNYFNAPENAQNMRDWAYMTSLTIALQEKCFKDAISVCPYFNKVLSLLKQDFIGQVESSGDLEQNFRTFAMNAKEYVHQCALGQSTLNIDPDAQFKLAQEACTNRANNAFKLLYSDKATWDQGFWEIFKDMRGLKCFREDRDGQIAVELMKSLERINAGQVLLRNNFHYLLRNHAETEKASCEALIADLQTALKLVFSRQISREEGSRLLTERKSLFDDYKTCSKKKNASDFCMDLIENSKGFLTKMLFIEDDEKYYNDVQIFLGDLPTVFIECETPRSAEDLGNYQW